MKRSRLNISRLAGLAALGATAFAGVTVTPANDARAEALTLRVPVSGENLVPGTLSFVQVTCSFISPFSSGENEIFSRSQNINLSDSATEFSETLSFEFTSEVLEGRPIGSYRCSLTGRSTSSNASGVISAGAAEPLRAHPGSVVSVEGRVPGVN